MLNTEIKKLRKQAGWTQTQLAERLGVSQATVASWESGIRRPDLSLLPAIAAVFGVTVNDIYGDDAPKDDLAEEAMAIRERMRRDPNYRLLFQTADKASPEHIRAAAAMLKALEPTDDE